MLDYDKKRSNVAALVHIVLEEVFFLFLGSVAKKMRNSQVLMQRKAVRIIFKGERGPMKF